MNNKTVITYGTFDLFHVGHLRLIERMRDFGETIIVAVSTDEFNKLKGKKSIIPYQHRAEIVANIKGVDLVIPEESWEQKQSDLEKYKVNTFIMGDDWKGKFDELKNKCEVVYLPRTSDISTSNLKLTLQKINPNVKKDLENIFSILESIQKELIY